MILTYYYTYHYNICFSIIIFTNLLSKKLLVESSHSLSRPHTEARSESKGLLYNNSSPKPRRGGTTTCSEERYSRPQPPSKSSSSSRGQITTTPTTFVGSRSSSSRCMAIKTITSSAQHQSSRSSSPR